MAACSKCDFIFDPGSAPGGQCPRCLLLGLHEDSFEGLHIDPLHHEEPLTSLEDDELAEELPGFELVERIGRGGMGVVWRARERVLDRYVAIKLLRNVSNDPAFVERFTREARVMAQLNHPNIVTLYSFGRTRSNHCYLVMEMVEGTDLANLIGRNRLDVAASLTVISEICSALSHAHDAGFVHRDIKPGNVLIDTRGHVKVADFGLARLNRRNDKTTLSITKHGFAVGTPHYVAPEQANGKGQEDHRADIYSLGVMLYQMLTHELPRGVFKPPSFKQKLDKRLDKIVLRALQEEPEKRYQQVVHLNSDLQRVREKIDPVLLAEMKAARHAARWRQRFEMGLAVAVSVLLGIMSAWYAREWLEAPAPAPTPTPVALRSPGQATAPASRSASVAAPAPGPASAPSQIDGGIRWRSVVDVPAVEGLTVTRIIRLQPPAMPSGTRFGKTVLAWENWLAISATNDAPAGSSGHGSVYLYQRLQKEQWTLVQRIANPDEETDVQFGHSLALNDGLLLVGAPTFVNRLQGRAHLYRLDRARNLWTPDTASFVLPEERTECFGAGAAIEKGRAAIGDIIRTVDPLRPKSAISLFTLNETGTAWNPELLKPEEGTIVPASVFFRAGEFLASVVDLESSPSNGVASGLLNFASDRARQRIVPRRSAPAGTRSGCTKIAATDRIVAAGAPNSDERRGRCWILARQPDGRWAHEAELSPPPEAGRAEFGNTVALHGNWLAVGADRAQRAGESGTGAVYLYQRTAGSDPGWTLRQTLQPSPNAVLSDFGNAVALGDHFIAIGAPNSDATAPKGRSLAGAVVVYEIAENLGTPADAAVSGP